MLLKNPYLLPSADLLEQDLFLWEEGEGASRPSPPLDLLSVLVVAVGIEANRPELRPILAPALVLLPAEAAAMGVLRAFNFMVQVSQGPRGWYQEARL